MKQALIALLLLVAIASQAQKDSIVIIPGDNSNLSAETRPCPLDTLKGILIWHCVSDVNEGNCWDYGYWVGKCWPMGEMPLEDLTFIPGVWKRRFRMAYLGQPFKTYEDEYVNQGFRDASWHKISGRRVYAFIILRGKKEEPKP